MTHPFYKKQRLPRRLKKAARHVDFDVCDMLPKAPSANTPTARRATGTEKELF